MGIVRYENLSPEEKASFDKAIAEQKQREVAFYESWGFDRPAEITAARAAYQVFLEKETRENPHNFYKSPMAQKMFMIGRLLAIREMKGAQRGEG